MSILKIPIKEQFDFHNTITQLFHQWIPTLESEDCCEKHHNHQTSNTRHTLVGNKIVDHSDVVEASPVGTAPTTFSFST